MKISFAIVAGLLFMNTAISQVEVTLDSLNNHIGDSVKVCTKIYGGIFLDRNKDSITLLNAGGMYPNAPLTILVRVNARQQFQTAPEVLFKNKEVCITGKLILYKEKPEIVVYDEKQILIQQ